MGVSRTGRWTIVTMSKRQTASFLMNRFAAAGIRPDNRRGQNFLIDLNLLELLATTADVQTDEVVLEVGTGLGSLTVMLAQRAAGVVTVEVDSRLQQLAAEQLIDFINVTMLHQDALRNKNNIDARVTDAVWEALKRYGARRYKLVANLPYSIATPIISNLLSIEPAPASMTVTIQRELADRIVARPNSRDYGALSIWLQSQCDVEIVRVMPPAVFWPRPKVHSAIVHIVPREEKRARIPDRDFFHEFVRMIFLHRRKFLRACLVSAYGRQLSKADIDELLAEQRIPPHVRAEQLDIEVMLELANAVQRKIATLESPSPPT